LLRLTAGALATAPFASLLAACGGDGGGSSSTASTVPFREPFDRSRPWWLQGNFAPVQTEREAFDLEVRGAIPRALDGLYVRNGSNAASGKTGHWFLGDGMVHGVRLERGKARWYRNRFVRTALYERGDALGDSGGPPGGADGYSNVSVFTHAGRLLTSGEIGYPYRLSPDDLSTVGVHDFDGRLATNMTAHPKVDPATGRMHFFGYGFTAPFLTYHVADENGALVSSIDLDVGKSTMMHDFAITERDAVFWELPVLFDLDLAIEGLEDPGGMLFPFRWDPSYGARIGVLPLVGPADAIRWVEIDPCYVFHGVNAFRDGDDVVVDVCRFDSMFSRGVEHIANERGALHRWRVGTGGAALTFHDEVLEGEVPIDLPTIDKRHTGRAHRYGWFAETRDNDDTVDFAGIARRDFRTGALARWQPEVGVHAGEALFVPDGKSEGEGWALAYVYDARDEQSVLAILDATDVAAGPVAEVVLPQRVPYGFHATWV
jgi:carotenoid cleavage dioxygenase